MKTGKIFLTGVSLTLLVAALVMLGSCKKGETGIVEPDMAALLKSGTWKVKTITVDGTDRFNLFTGFTVAFSASSFSAANGEPVWPATGTWTLNEETKTITRGDGVTAIVGDGLSETSLTLTLVWAKTTFGGGRIESVSGNHVFTFGK